MRPRERSYGCSVCGWQGMLEPSYPANDAACPNCGTLLYPRTWGETWGVAILIVGLTVGIVALAAYLL